MISNTKNREKAASHYFVNRDCCPACNSKLFTQLTEVNPIHFINTNPTINIEQLEFHGFTELDRTSLLRCNSCRLVYTDRLLNKDMSKLFWSEVFISEASRTKIFRTTKHIEHQKKWLSILNYLQRFDNFESLESGYNTLDFGSGWGDFLYSIKSDGVNTYGIEIDSAKVEFSKSRQIITYDALEKLPEKLQIDFFHSDQVFEHLQHPQKVMDSIKPLLKPNFLGFIGVPNYNDNRINKVVGASNNQQFRDKDLLIWDHLNFFSPRSLADFLQSNGFEIFDIATGLRIEEIKTTDVYFRSSNKGITKQSSQKRNKNLWSRFRGS